MDQPNVGILHPGDMGISVAATIRNGGAPVCWVSAGRSAASRQRAEQHGLQDAETLAALVEQCAVIVSVCPPAAAENVAESVLALGFRGLFLDANAISPQRAQRIGAVMTSAGASFVDGGIIGGPAWKPNTTRLYLSGAAAGQAAEIFAAGPLETTVIGAEIGKASALKMCYAAYTKGSTALLCAALGAAEALGVRADLERQWTHDSPDRAEQHTRQVRQVTAKAWRFVGEMDEIAATFAEAGIPDDFHRGAHEIYTRMAEFKDEADTPPLEDVLNALLNRD